MVMLNQIVVTSAAAYFTNELKNHKIRGVISLSHGTTNDTTFIMHQSQQVISSNIVSLALLQLIKIFAAIFPTI